MRGCVSGLCGLKEMKFNFGFSLKMNGGVGGLIEDERNRLMVRGGVIGLRQQPYCCRRRVACRRQCISCGGKSKERKEKERKERKLKKRKK